MTERDPPAVDGAAATATGPEAGPDSRTAASVAPSAIGRVADALAARFGTDPALVTWALHAHPTVVRDAGVDATAAAVVVLRSRGTDAPCSPAVAAAAVDARPARVAAAAARLSRRAPAFRSGRR